MIEVFVALFFFVVGNDEAEIFFFILNVVVDEVVFVTFTRFVRSSPTIPGGTPPRRSRSPLSP